MGAMMIRFEYGDVEYFGKVKMQFDIKSTEHDKFLIIDKILQQLALEFNILDNRDVSKIRLCLDEALTNAMEHGNMLDSTKNIKIKYIVGEGDRQNSKSCFGFAISDEGPGFARKDLPDFENPEFLETSIGGRGLLLIANISQDFVYYEKTNEFVFMIQI